MVPKAPSTAQRALYLKLAPDPVFAVFHASDAEDSSGAGVVLCPPFGYEELCVRRSYMRAGEMFAAAGYPTLRIDLPGTGESGGSPRGPARLEAWCGAVAGAASWLRETTGVERVVAFGVGLGGVLATLATADGAPIDDLVLWSVPARGRVLLREYRALAQIVAGQWDDDTAGRHQEDGSLEIAGFVLSADTRTTLERIDLTTLELPDAAAKRVLLLGRDAIPVDQRLREHLEQSGAAITVASGTGYGAMMSTAETSEVPRELLLTTIGWIGEGPTRHWVPSATPLASPVVAADQVELPPDQPDCREIPIEIDVDGQRMRGVLVEPLTAPAPLCAVLLNDGASRRIGPNRQWVEASRGWAAQGVSTLRFDLLGIGDSDGEDGQFPRPRAFYAPDIGNQLLAALDALKDRGFSGRFLLVGLCSGAYLSFQASLVDERVVATVLINLGVFYPRTGLKEERRARQIRQLLRNRQFGAFLRYAFSPGVLRRANTAIRHVARRITTRKQRAALPSRIDQAFASLYERRVRTLLLISLGERLGRELTEMGRIEEADVWPGAAVVRIPTRDHSYTAIWAQQFVRDVLDRELERALVASRAAVAATSAGSGVE